MSNLKLVITENFGNISCDFYRNMNDDILLTREQIGSALEYSNPGKAIQKIHLKHKDRLDPLSMKCKEIRYPNLGVRVFQLKQHTIQNVGSWKYVVGARKRKRINSWIGVGM